MNTVSPISNSVYTVSGTDVNNCVNTATQNVYVNALPTITISGTSTVCAGSTTTLTASGASAYSWINGPNAASNTVSPSANTSYTVTGTDANNCSNSSTVFIQVTALPVIVNLGASSLCKGQPTTLNLIGATTYTWSGGSNASSITIMPMADTNCVVMGTNLNNCVNTATISVTVHVPSAITINGANSTCVGQSIPLIANGANTYTWVAGPSGSAYTVTPLSNTIYTVTGTDLNNCINKATHTVSVIPLPIISITGTTVVCKGNTTTLTAIGASTYSWSNGSTSSANVVAPVSNTTYAVWAKDTNDCVNTISQLVTVSPLPDVLINQGEANLIITSGASVNLAASGAVHYQWTSGNVSCTACAMITESPTTNTQYCISGINSNNCSNTSCIDIIVQELCGQVFIPDAFSPNGDGVNDLFKVYGKCIDKLALQIFDRWGNQIFETSDPLSGWNGTFQGHEMNTGTYLYQANYTLNNGVSDKMHGNFFLIR